MRRIRSKDGLTTSGVWSLSRETSHPPCVPAPLLLRATQVHRIRAHARPRPPVRASPAVRAHHEDPHLRWGGSRVAPQVPIHPAAHGSVVVQRRVGAEVALAGFPALDRAHTVSPRSENQRVARGFIVLHRAARPVHLVEPAGEIEHSCLHPIVSPGEPHRVPPCIPRRVPHPLEVPGGDALQLRQVEHRPESPRRRALERPCRLGGRIGGGSGDAEPASEIRSDVEPGPVEPGAVPDTARGPEVLRRRVGHRRHHGAE